MDCFPARLRHILDNLFSNALKSRDPDKDQAWVHLPLRVSPEGYQFRVTDNNSLLRLYDQANDVSQKSLSQRERARAGKAVERISQELQRRKVTF